MNQMPRKVSLLPLPPFHPPLPPAFSSFETLTHVPFTFQDLCLTLFCPFLSCWKPKQIDRAKPKYSVNSLQRGFLRRQQAADLYFLPHNMGMQQIWPAVPWRVLAQWNHFVQWCSGLPPNFISPKLPYAVYWRAQLAGGYSVPLPLTPALCIFSTVWATCGEEIYFLCLSVAFGPCTSVSANTRFFVSPSLTGGWFTMSHNLKHLLCVFGLAKWPSVHPGLCFLLLWQEQQIQSCSLQLCFFHS